jgi:hypothetical protein
MFRHSNFEDRFFIYLKYLGKKKYMEIGAYFQCYKQPCATFRSLALFRQSYPKGTIVLVSDNGLNYSMMANFFNCIYIHDKVNTNVNWKSTDRYNTSLF